MIFQPDWRQNQEFLFNIVSLKRTLESFSDYNQSITIPNSINSYRLLYFICDFFGLDSKSCLQSGFVLINCINKNGIYFTISLSFNKFSFTD